MFPRIQFPFQSRWQRGVSHKLSKYVYALDVQDIHSIQDDGSYELPWAQEFPKIRVHPSSFFQSFEVLHTSPSSSTKMSTCFGPKDPFFLDFSPVLAMLHPFYPCLSPQFPHVDWSKGRSWPETIDFPIEIQPKCKVFLQIFPETTPFPHGFFRPWHRSSGAAVKKQLELSRQKAEEIRAIERKWREVARCGRRRWTRRTAKLGGMKWLNSLMSTLD